MFVPYFSGDSETYSFKKLKVIFLVRKIQISDLFLFFILLLPPLINLFWYLIIKGQSDFKVIFYPMSNFFTSKEFKDWNSLYGYLHIGAIFAVLFFRSIYSYALWKKMKEYARKREKFEWSKRSMYVLTVFVPFVSFITYISLLKTVNSEYFHKYNL